MYLIIGLIAFLASGLTLFSGFGLGTVLVPVFAIFFPVAVAVALVAVVHFLNNLFKLFLLGRHADKGVVLRFGLPAILAAIGGARLLLRLSELPPLTNYQAFGQNFEITAVKLVIATLMIVFASFEVVPAFESISFDKEYLPLGGLISGFFGGLSGHQGAIRSAFLIRYGLSKESFIATGVVIAVLVDITRLSVYVLDFPWASFAENRYVVLTATVAAFLGAFLGSRLLKKITIRTVQVIVAVMLAIIAIGLGTGVI